MFQGTSDGTVILPDNIYYVMFRLLFLARMNPGLFYLLVAALMLWLIVGAYSTFFPEKQKKI